MKVMMICVVFSRSQTTNVRQGGAKKSVVLKSKCLSPM